MLLCGAVAAAAITFGAPTGAFAKHSMKHTMKTLDPDANASVTFDEAHTAAGKKFEMLDKKHSGKSKSPIAKAMNELRDTDKQLMIDKTEYMAGADAAFQEADGDKDGEIEPSELKTPAGKRFLKLVE